MSDPISEGTAVLARLEKVERTIETLVSELELLPGGNALRRLGAKLRSVLEAEGVTPSTPDSGTSFDEPPAAVAESAARLGVHPSELLALLRSRV